MTADIVSCMVFSMSSLDIKRKKPLASPIALRVLSDPLFGGSEAKLAKEIGVTIGCISNWFLSRKRLGVRYAVKIEKLTRGRILWSDIRPDLAL